MLASCDSSRSVQTALAKLAISHTNVVLELEYHALTMPGAMQRTLEELLRCRGKVSHKTLNFPKPESVCASALKFEIESVYHSLGGILPSIPLNLRQWDLEFDGIAVELDECLHFNCYRTITLKSKSYKCLLPGFPLEDYQRYCSEQAEECVRAGCWGKRWSNKSSAAQFGEPSLPKDLGGNGSPRWKQRAFYDFVKDLSPLLINVPVVRIAVWDTVEDGVRRRTVKEVLEAPFGCASGTALAVLINGRAPL